MTHLSTGGRVIVVVARRVGMVWRLRASCIWLTETSADLEPPTIRVVPDEQLPEHVRANREAWDTYAHEYVDRGRRAWGEEPHWGIWHIPETDLQLLPSDLAGKDVIELGCGTAYFGAWLKRAGARRVVGVDVTPAQLETARRLDEEFRLGLELIEANAESVPLPDGSFDVVFSDHGALSWGDPPRVVSEAARLLRPGGRLVFNVTSPFARMCLDEEAGRQTEELLRPYFGLHRVDEGDGAATYNLGYGEWVRLLRANGLAVEDLVEPRPPDGAATTYGIPVEWAKRWPAECIWVCRKT